MGNNTRYYVLSNENLNQNEATRVWISTEPGRTNMSNQILTEGWLGNTNDICAHAHGEFETEKEARDYIESEWPVTHEADREPHDVICDENEVAVYYVHRVVEGPIVSYDRDTLGDFFEPFHDLSEDTFAVCLDAGTQSVSEEVEEILRKIYGEDMPQRSDYRYGNGYVGALDPKLYQDEIVKILESRYGRVQVASEESPEFFYILVADPKTADVHTGAQPEQIMTAAYGRAIKAENPGFLERIELADKLMRGQIYLLGEAPDSLKELFQSIQAEKEDHEDQADRHAEKMTGITLAADFSNAITVGSGPYGILRDAEFDRLESAARERRLLAVASAFEQEFEYTYDDTLENA